MPRKGRGSKVVLAFCKYIPKASVGKYCNKPASEWWMYDQWNLGGVFVYNDELYFRCAEHTITKTNPSNSHIYTIVPIAAYAKWKKTKEGVKFSAG